MSVLCCFPRLITRLGMVTAFVTSAAAVVGCGAGSLLRDLEDEFNQYGILRTPTAADFPSSNAVVIVDSRVIEMEFNTNFDVETIEDVHVIKRIFKTDHTTDEANVEISMSRDENLLSIEARTINPDGRAVYLRNNEFHLASGVTVGSEFVSDRRVLKFAFKDVQPGSILEWRYRVHYSQSFGSTVWWIQNRHPTILNQLRIDVPLAVIDGTLWDWYYKAFAYELDEPIVLESTTSNQTKVRRKKSFIWRTTKIPSFAQEPSSPSVYEIAGNVRFGTKLSWNEKAKLFLNRYWKTASASSAPVAAKARELVAGVERPIDQVKMIARYVSAMRYTAIEVGEGAWRPMRPVVVLDRQYGDCKDKSTLLIAMLEDLGIKAYPVLTRTYDLGPLDPHLPTLSWFNHMIVKVELTDSTIWIDPTVSVATLGDLPWQDQGIQVLVLQPDSNSGYIDRTPAPAAYSNTTEMDVLCTWSGKDTLEYTITLTAYGVAAQQWATLLTSSALPKMVLSDAFARDVDSLSVNFQPYSGNPLQARFRLKVPGALIRQGELYQIELDPVRPSQIIDDLTRPSRKLPIRHDYPFTLKKTCRFEFPTDYSILQKPGDFTLDIGAYHYSKTFGLDADWLYMTEVLRVEDRDVSAADYGSIRSFFEKVRSSQRERLFLSDVNREGR